MDRLPKKPPFAIGVRLKYIGTNQSWTYDIDPTTKEKKEVAIQMPGMIVTISEVRSGRRGTMRHLTDENGPMFYEDTGEPILDITDDGYSVYYVNAWQNGKKQGRCIFPENMHEWEIV